MDDIHRAFGLIAVGLTLSEIEELLDVQSGTTTGRLLATFRDENAWIQARNALTNKFAIAADELDRLERTVREVAHGTRSFQPLMRPRRVLSEPQRRYLAFYRDRESWERLKRDMVADFGLDVFFEKIERPLQKIEAGFLPPGSYPRPGRETKARREALRRRIENIIVYKLAITRDGDLVRCDVEASQLAWVCKIRAAGHVPIILDEFSRMVYDQIRRPNKAALTLRLLVPGHDRPLTLSCLAGGIECDEDSFCDCMKNIVIELDYVGWLRKRTGRPNP